MLAKDRYLDYYKNVDKKLFRKKFKYDPDTGELLRDYKNGNWRAVRRTQYKIPSYFCHFKNNRILAPDAVWFLCNGEWPTERLVAHDGSLFNTKIDNLTLESTTLTRLGSIYIKPLEFGTVFAKVYHYPYFNRSSTFKNIRTAEKWAKETLSMYNKYAYATKAASEFDGESKEVEITGIWFHSGHGTYEVRVKVDNDWKHYCYRKNIEDAMEQQVIGQAEVDEVWADTNVTEIPVVPEEIDDVMPW